MARPKRVTADLVVVESSTRQPAQQRKEEIICEHLPDTLTARVTHLSQRNQKTLLKKQEWLKQYTITIPRDMERNGTSHVVDATLVFAQEEAGTAVCISPDGLILTCSHCVAESEDELDRSQTHWLLSASGRTVASRCVAWDSRRDLALLRVTAAQGPEHDFGKFPHIEVGEEAPAPNARLVCVGHPGSEDLEASLPGVKTNYDTLFLSTGAFRGLDKGQDPHDNAEIGALKHTCWTYWGHSGAPLIHRQEGKLVGLHSSWDDKTGMRRGVPLEAIRAFLEENSDV
jgi:hypothetical protein